MKEEEQKINLKIVKDSEGFYAIANFETKKVAEFSNFQSCDDAMDDIKSGKLKFHDFVLSDLDNSDWKEYKNEN